MLWTMLKDKKGAREGEGRTQIGVLERELKRRPLFKGMVGSSTQSLNLPSIPVEASRWGWMVGGSHCILIHKSALEFKCGWDGLLGEFQNYEQPTYHIEPTNHLYCGCKLLFVHRLSLKRSDLRRC